MAAAGRGLVLRSVGATASGGGIAPPRPDYAAVLAASGVASVVYLASSDAGLAAAVAIVVGLLVFPLAFVARELAYLARDVDQSGASRVYEWVAGVASRLGVKGVQLAYTVRTGVGGIQVVSLGGTADPAGSRITAMLHRAAWHGAPVAEYSGGRLLLVVPGLVMERLTSLAVREGKKVSMLVTSVADMKLVYSVLKSIARAITGSKPLAAYIASKLVPRLVTEGMIALAASPRTLERLEKLMPFEDPITRFRVRRQLRLEQRLSHGQP